MSEEQQSILKRLENLERVVYKDVLAENLRCKHCSRVFSSKENKRHHQANCKQQQSNRTCKYCSKVLKFKRSLPTHYKKCPKKPPGGTTTDSEYDPKNLERIVYKDVPEENLRCKHCSRVFSSKENKRHHQANCKQQQSNRTCKYCSKVLKFKRSLPTHYKKCPKKPPGGTTTDSEYDPKNLERIVYKDVPEENLRCKHCSRVFSSKENKRHHQANCKQQQSNRTCKYCSKVLKFKRSLPTHYKKCPKKPPGGTTTDSEYDPKNLERIVYKDVPEENLRCKHCSRVFSSKENKRHHQANCKQQQSNRTCKYCSKVLKFKRSLPTHYKKCPKKPPGGTTTDSEYDPKNLERIVYKDVPEENLRCKHCSRVFSSKENKRHHQANCKQQQSNRTCKYCSKVLKFKRSLITHYKKCPKKPPGGTTTDSECEPKEASVSPNNQRKGDDVEKVTVKIEVVKIELQADTVDSEKE